MTINVCSYDEWEARSSRRLATGLSPKVFAPPGREKITIHPRISDHAGLTILADDWLPLQSGGGTTFEWMVHTPSQYPQKSLSLALRDGAWLPTTKDLLSTQDSVVMIGGCKNYYHWLIDYLPRLLVADGMEEYQGWPLVMNQGMAAHQLESLSLLGIDAAQMMLLEPGQGLQAACVAVPTLLSTTTLCHPAVHRMLRHAFPPTLNLPRKRIYLSRDDASNRRLTNEPELLELLRRYGFEKYVAGDMSFQDQVNLFASADAVVTAHGAGMTNIVFSPPGAEVFEIAFTSYRVSSMHFLAVLGGQPHGFINARVADSRHPSPLLNDWEVDLAHMQSALESRLGQRPAGRAD
ncbi:MAG: glycosyltransferase family 61 protein [Haliea sp.]|nr:MAG: glycosyltransferase family 61 protein [Haliea sp.]